MPALPTTPTLPDPERDHAGWAALFLRAFQGLWTRLIFTVNALCKVDTLANRTDEPDLDETFFVVSDTKQLFAGVSGAWQNVGPRRGQATITNPDTTATVTLSPAEPDTAYHVELTPNYATTVFWSGKATGQFVVNVGTAPGATGLVDWALWRS